jgi:hypothetical protein
MHLGFLLLTPSNLATIYSSTMNIHTVRSTVLLF